MTSPGLLRVVTGLTCAPTHMAVGPYELLGGASAVSLSCAECGSDLALLFEFSGLTACLSYSSSWLLVTRCCSAQPAPALWDPALGKVPTHSVLRLLLAASLFPFKVQLAFAALSQPLCQEVSAFSSFKTHQLKNLTLYSRNVYSTASFLQSPREVLV